MTSERHQGAIAMRRRRIVFSAVLLTSAVVLGVLHGLLLGLTGAPQALLSWWGTALRAVIAVLTCLGLASAADRWWTARRSGPVRR